MDRTLYGELEIEYTDLFQDVTRRKISDLQFDGFDYNDACRHVDAFCHMRNSRRTFKINRILVLLEDGTKAEGRIFFESEIRRVAESHGIPLHEASFELEARDAAAKVKSRSQFANLCNRLECLYEKHYTATTEEAHNRIDRRYEKLSYVVQHAALRYLEFQYLPWDLDVFAPSLQLNYVCMVCTPNRCRQLRMKHPFLAKKEEWWGMCAHNEPEPPPLWLAGLKSFLKVVESSLSLEAQPAAIDELVRSTPESFARFFDLSSDLSPYDQWRIMIMQNEGIPRAKALYRAGFTSVDQCLGAKGHRLLEVKGVGPDTLDKIFALRKSHH